MRHLAMPGCGAHAGAPAMPLPVGSGSQLSMMGAACTVAGMLVMPKVTDAPPASIFKTVRRLMGIGNSKSKSSESVHYLPIVQYANSSALN
jgi:hypothetical protein